MKLTIGQVTPLVFSPENDPQAHELRFTQRFGRYDHIMVQGVGDTKTTVYARVYNALTASQVTYNACTRVNMGGGKYMYSTSLPVLAEGLYYVRVTASGMTAMLSEVFEVTQLVEDDPDWLLLEYGGTSNATNMDNMFVVSGVRQAFLLRLPGGFKPQGYEPGLEVETYRTQMQELRVLYSAPYDKWTLTVGTAAGLPVEYIRMLNWVLSCEYVYINGVRWVRSENAVVSKQLTMTGAQMFTASVVLERQPSLDNYPDEVYDVGADFNDDYNDDFNNV